MQNLSCAAAILLSCVVSVACEGLEPLSPKREALAGTYRLAEVSGDLANGERWSSEEVPSHVLHFSDSSSYYLTYDSGVYEIEGDKIELFTYVDGGVSTDKREPWRAYTLVSLTEDELVLQLQDPMSGAGLTSPLGSRDSLLRYEETWVRD